MANRPIIWTGHEDAFWLAEKTALIVRRLQWMLRDLELQEATNEDLRDHVLSLKMELGVVIGALFADVKDADKINDLFRYNEGNEWGLADVIMALGRNSVYWEKSYKELLNLPEWQKKRLEVLKVRRWRCESCDATDAPLHVHHKRYGAGLPWDLPNDAFEVLCETCHAKEHAA